MTDIDFTITREDILRTRVTLAELAGEQERLAAALEETGITSFVDRADWLVSHWSADRQLAWRRYWRALGVVDPEPRSEHFDRGASLAVPKPRPKRRRHKFTPTQLRIAREWAERQEKVA